MEKIEHEKIYFSEMNLKKFETGKRFNPKKEDKFLKLVNLFSMSEYLHKENVNH